MRNLSQHKARVDGERLYLRTLLPDDASEEYASWLNDPVVNEYLETRQTTLPELRAYIQKRDESAETVFFGIFWKENDKHIGNVKLEPIDAEKGTAVMGLLIGDKDYWGKGVGTEVTDLITNYGFEELDLREVTLGVIASNKPAIRVYEKCGYEITKVEKDGVDHDGVLYDKVHMRKLSPLSSPTV